jgi:membrane fusion protein (multidrug efflux system)
MPANDNIIALPQTAVVTSLYGDYVYVVTPADAPAAPASTGSDTPLRQSIPSEADAAKVKPAATEQPAASPAPASDPQPAATAQQPAPAAERLIAKQVFVTVGRRQGNEIEIVKGLEPGQQVVTSGQNKLSNNAAVTINNDVDPAKLSEDNGGASP